MENFLSGGKTDRNLILTCGRNTTRLFWITRNLFLFPCSLLALLFTVGSATDVVGSSLQLPADPSLVPLSDPCNQLM